MEVRYYKEQHRNYMVIRQTESDKEVGYHSGMLRSHNMDHLLHAGVRVVDGQKFNYYDITSRLSLRQLFVSRDLRMDDLTALFSGIRDACDEIDRYLLDVNRLDLDPELIFYNCTREQYFFLYNISVPVSESREAIGKFMDYLLDKTDSDDPKATDLTYGLYERYERGGFDVWDLVQSVSDAMDTQVTPAAGRPVTSANAGFPGEQYDPYASSSQSTISEAASAEMLDDLRDSYADVNRNSASARSREPHKDGLTMSYFLIPALGLLGLIACACVYMLMKLDKDEFMILIAALAASGVTFLAGLVRLAYHKFGKASSGIGSGSMGETADPAPVSESAMVHMQDFVAPIERPARKSQPSKGRNVSSLVQESNEEYSNEGQTTFFGDVPVGTGYKLYALDRRNKKHIELNRLPCTIGKLAGYVDFILDHPSVSRVHAKIENEDGRLMLSDMNSTNGVFLNGIRLQPNERREIEEGDEIRFGSLNYCLRHAG